MSEGIDDRAGEQPGPAATGEDVELGGSMPVQPPHHTDEPLHVAPPQALGVDDRDKELAASNSCKAVDHETSILDGVVPVKYDGQAPISVANVLFAIDELQSKNKKPTQRNIREQIGGGSYSLISPVLNAWRKRQLLQSSVKGSDVPSAVLGNYEAFLSLVWHQAQQQADTFIAGQKVEMAAWMDSQAREYEKIESENDALNVSVKMQTRANAELRDQLETMTLKLAEIQGQLEAKAVEAESSAAQNELLRQQLSSLTSRYDTLQGVQSELRAENAAMRANLEEQERQVASLASRYGKATEENQELKTSLGRVASELQSSQDECRRTSAALEHLTNEHRTQQEALVASQRDCVVLETRLGEMESLKEQLKLSQLKAEALESAIGEGNMERQQLNNDNANLKQALASAAAKIDELSASLRSSQKDLNAALIDVAKLNARQETMAEMVKQLSGNKKEE